VLKVDMLVEGTDVPRGMTYRQAARKAVAMCVSDFASKGVRPDSFLVSLGLRRGVTRKQVRDLGLGFADAENEWGVHLVGGDTNEASEVVIDCAMVGFGSRVVKRSGCKRGDLVVVSGRFGLPPSGLKIITGEARAGNTYRHAALSSVFTPKVNMEAGLALAPHLTSGMDSSDGLARSLHTLADASGVGFEVAVLPGARGVKEFAAVNRLSYEELVLNGGEEFVVVGTIGWRGLEGATRDVKRTGGELIAIGRATNKKGEVVLSTDRIRKRIENVGWTHLG